MVPCLQRSDTWLARGVSSSAVEPLCSPCALSAHRGSQLLNERKLAFGICGAPGRSQRIRIAAPCICEFTGVRRRRLRRRAGQGRRAPRCWRRAGRSPPWLLSPPFRTARASLAGCRWWIVRRAAASPRVPLGRRSKKSAVVRNICGPVGPRNTRRHRTPKASSKVQTEQALPNLAAVLSAAGSSMDPSES